MSDRTHGGEEGRFAQDEFALQRKHLRRRHGRSAGRRSERIFDHGALRFVLLQLIEEKPRHGYELIKAIEESLGGAYSPSPGVVYPTLSMLEDLGYASVTASEGGKKLYAATPEGAAFLLANKETVEALSQRTAKARATYGQGPAPQILRAMENLKLALRLRLGRGPLSEEQIRAVATVLDEAAVAVERS